MRRFGFKWVETREKAIRIADLVESLGGKVVNFSTSDVDEVSGRSTHVVWYASLQPEFEHELIGALEQADIRCLHQYLT